jgi:hypothetical protein
MDKFLNFWIDRHMVEQVTFVWAYAENEENNIPKKSNIYEFLNIKAEG